MAELVKVPVMERVPEVEVNVPPDTVKFPLMSMVPEPPVKVPPAWR